MLRREGKPILNVQRSILRFVHYGNTHTHEKTDCRPALLDLVDVAENTTTDGDPTRRPCGLHDAPEHERRHGVAPGDAEGADAEEW